MPITAIASRDVGRWLEELSQKDADDRRRRRRKVSRETRRHCLNLVRGCFEQAIADGVIEANPAHGIKLRREGKNAHAAEGTAAFLHALLEPENGIARLSRALAHKVPMARAEAMAALLLIGTRDAADVLRHANAAEAAAGLALLRGHEPDPPPEPVGEIVEVGGRPTRVYSMDEIMAAGLPDFVKSCVECCSGRFGPLAQRWRAS